MHGDVEQRVRVESLEIDRSGGGHEAVILLRDLKRPECLFGRRAPTVEPMVDHMDPQFWATVVWANLEEDLTAIGYGLPKQCSLVEITWF